MGLWHVQLAKVGYQAQVIPALLAGLALALLKLVLSASCRITSIWWWCRLFADPRGVPRPCADWSVWCMIGDGVAFAVRHLMTGSFARLARHCLASCTPRW